MKLTGIKLEQILSLHRHEQTELLDFHENRRKAFPRQRK